MKLFNENDTLEDKRATIDAIIALHNASVTFIPTSSCATAFGIAKMLMEQQEIALATYFLLSCNDDPIIDKLKKGGK